MQPGGFWRWDREVDFREVRPRGVEVVLDLVVLACSEETTSRSSNRRTWRSHYRRTCLLDMQINCAFLSELPKISANSWR